MSELPFKIPSEAEQERIRQAALGPLATALDETHRLVVNEVIAAFAAGAQRVDILQDGTVVGSLYPFEGEQ